MGSLIRAAALAAIATTVLASTSSAQVQDSAQRKCLTSTATAASKLARTRVKEYAKCLKSAANEDLVGCSADDCLTSDASGKVGDALAKLRDVSAVQCRTRPDFAYRHPSFLGSVVLEETIGLHDDLIGGDLDDAAVLRSTDSRAASCQGKLVKAATKQFLTMSAIYDACRKTLLDDEAVTSAAGFQACLDAITTDAQGKVAAAGRSIEGALGGVCDGLTIATVLGGACASALDPGACMEDRSRCRTCRRAVGSDGLSTDCDLFDNGAADDSCTGVAGRCNGRADLCDRPYDAVSYVTTHNAFCNDEENWLQPNQRYGLTRQLSEGVRGMMLDTYEHEGALYVCHGLCTLGGELKTGKAPLVEELVKIREFLDVNPASVVSIIFESYITELQTEEAFDDAGLLPYVHSQPVGMPWPTLQEMIDAGTRLVVFTDDSSTALPWHHYVWDFAWETPYSFEEEEDFVCSINRGDMDNSLYILNHFLTDIFGSPQLANQVNHDPEFIDRALQCQVESGRLPNFVTMDFYDIGDAFSVVGTLNGFGQCVP